MSITESSALNRAEDENRWSSEYKLQPVVTEGLIVLTEEEFDKLSEYSTSLPTGITIGKRWKRAVDFRDVSKGWILGEYVACVKEHSSRKVDVSWKTIKIRDEGKVGGIMTSFLLDGAGAKAGSGESAFMKKGGPYSLTQEWAEAHIGMDDDGCEAGGGEITVEQLQKEFSEHIHRTPVRGDIAMCSQGFLGMVTCDAPKDNPYLAVHLAVLTDPNSSNRGGLRIIPAWKGIHLENRTANGRTVKVGDPWSSRNPRVFGQMTTRLMVIRAILEQEEVTDAKE